MGDVQDTQLGADVAHDTHTRAVLTCLHKEAPAVGALVPAELPRGAGGSQAEAGVRP